MPAHQRSRVREWRGLGAHRATQKGEGIGRAAASWLAAEGGAALLLGLGVMVSIGGGLRQSLKVARRGAASTWQGVGLATLGWRRPSPSLDETLVWALLAVAIGVGIGLAVTLA